MTKTPTLYTLGYNGSRSRQTLAELVALGTPLLDIRKNPDGGPLAWTRDMLTQERGLIYMWIEALGNDLYARHNGDIQIHDLDAGMLTLERVVTTYGRACLMCACGDAETCHRLVISDEAVARLPGIYVIHLPAIGRGKQNVPASVLYTVGGKEFGYPVQYLTKAKKHVKTFHPMHTYVNEEAACLDFEAFYTSFEQSSARCVYVPPDLFQQHITALAHFKGEVA